MNTFLKMFGLSSESERNFGALFAELETLLEGHSEEKTKFVAGFAGLLGKVALSDNDVSQEESEEIEKIIRNKFDFDEGLYQSLLGMVYRHAEELRGIEDSRYLQLLNEVCSKQEKLDVMYCLFAVAAVDDSIVFEEDRELSLIAKGLNLTNREYTDIRVSFSEALEVLKGLGGK